MYARVAHSKRWFITNKKGPMLSNRALQRAKRMKQLETLMYIDPLFRSSYVFPLQKCDDFVNKETSIMRVKGVIQSLLKKMLKNR